MKSKYAHLVVLICAVLAFVPVLAVDYLLDSYVRTRETASLQKSADLVALDIKATADDAVRTLRRIVADSPSLCTPTFVQNIHKQMDASLHVREVVVENADGVQYCDAFGRQFAYKPISKVITVPGQSETIQVVHLGEQAIPGLRISQVTSSGRLVSAFVAVQAHDEQVSRADLTDDVQMRVSLTNGLIVASAGDTSLFEDTSGQDEIVVQSFAGEMPLRVEAAVPFSTVRSDYTDLDVGFTIISCLMCAAFLLVMLQYARRSQLPAFDLERAIARNEIKPYYQPVINLRTGKVSGCEVLCRWEKKNGQVVPPGQFIDYAEVTGLAIPMTLSLMQQVRSDLADLCREMPNLKISINLFEGHFRDSTIVDDVQAIFGGTPISYRQLQFEITERRPLGNSMQADKVIAGFHALGAKLAMDDVGTGHSNLAYMQTLGVDVIKIDRVFVDMVKPGTTQVPVLDGLIAMARDLGTEVIAEGVETEAQALYLRSHGVLLAQGFLFAPALKPAAFKQIARALNQPKGQAKPGDGPLPAAA